MNGNISLCSYSPNGCSRFYMVYDRRGRIKMVIEMRDKSQKPDNFKDENHNINKLERGTIVRYNKKEAEIMTIVK